MSAKHNGLGIYNLATLLAYQTCAKSEEEPHQRITTPVLDPGRGKNTGEPRGVAHALFELFAEGRELLLDFCDLHL